MNATATVRPTASTQISPLAAPATASTLSSDIETSATIICMSAAPNVMVCTVGGAPPPGMAPANACAAGAGSVISRYIFQHTHSSRMPPASVRPTMVSICVAMVANRMRSTTAPPTPQKITRARIEGCTRDAAMPTTMALSPASTKSITMICERAMSCWVRSTRSSTNVSE